MKKKTIAKRLLAICTAALMSVGIMAPMAFAEEIDTTQGITGFYYYNTDTGKYEYTYDQSKKPINGFYYYNTDTGKYEYTYDQSKKPINGFYYYNTDTGKYEYTYDQSKKGYEVPNVYDTETGSYHKPSDWTTEEGKKAIKKQLEELNKKYAENEALLAQQRKEYEEKIAAEQKAAEEATQKNTEAATSKFSDVTSSDYYAPAVGWATSNNVASGTTDTTFSPNNNCSREQFVTFLWRISGSPEPTVTENSFTDISPSDYGYKAMLWANEKGYVKGTSNTTASPDMNCTRAQIITIEWRVSGSKTDAAASNFSDVSSDEYYATAVNWAAANKYANGTTETTFSPNNNCSRAEAVTFLYRLFA